MTKPAEKIRRYVILDSDRRRYRRYLGSTVYFCRTQAEIATVLDQNLEGLTWISYAWEFTDELLKAVSRRRASTSRLSLGREDWVLTVAAPRPESMPSLHGLFPRIVGDSPAYRWLAREELTEMLLDPAGDRADGFIAVAADPVTKTLSLVRGDCRQLVVPFSLFPASSDGTAPDFSKPGVTDYGRTIALGDYEASADSILYETDPQYRKNIQRQRQETEKTFGASLLRLRKQRRLGRGDFAPLSSKTIARIERSEIDKPHGKTLHTIAGRLGVSPDEISAY